MSILTELTDMGAPPKVMEAAQECADCMTAGVSPPRSLVAYVQGWVARNQGQDRYGK